MKRLLFSYSWWFGYKKMNSFTSEDSGVLLLHNKKKKEFVVVHINSINQQGYSHFKNLNNAKKFFRSLVTAIIDETCDGSCHCFAENS